MSYHIMIVEDDFRNALMLEAVLETYQYSIVRARSAEEALVKLAIDKIDLIILDILLPEMDGREFLRFVRQDPKYDSIPIIAISAVSDPAMVESIKQVGGIDFFTKPVNVIELQKKIVEYLS